MAALGILLICAGFLAQSQAQIDLNCDKIPDLSNYFRCGFRQGNRCIYKDWECDENFDCSDGSDEVPCGYQQGIGYEYSYTSSVTFPNQKEGFTITATVKFEKEYGNNYFVMLIDNPVLTSRIHKGSSNLLDSKEIKIWKKPIKFERFDDGTIHRIFTDSDHPTDILNIKRAIVSLFQLKQRTRLSSYVEEETDVTGRCHQNYKVSKHAQRGHGMDSLHIINITKINDYSNCNERPEETNNFIPYIDCLAEPGNRIPKSRMITSCQVFHNAGKMTIDSCMARETHVLHAFASPLIITTTKHMQYKRIYIPTRDSGGDLDVDRGSLMFEFDGQHVKHGDLDMVEKTLNKIDQRITPGQMAWELMKPDVPGLYAKLIHYLRYLDPATFSDVYTRLYAIDNYRTWLESALPFIGTAESGAELRTKIESGAIKGMTATKLLTRQGAINRPTPIELVEEVMALCKSQRVLADWTIHSTCWLTFGSLVRTHCENMDSCPDHLLQGLKAQYNKFLHDEHYHMNDPADMENLVVTLKAIGNSGREELLPEILAIIKNWKEPNPVVIAGIEALRLMTLKKAPLVQAQAALFDIFGRRHMCPEIRVVAFEALMTTGPSPAMLSSLAETIRTEQQPSIRQYIFTSLEKDSAHKCEACEKKKAAERLLARLAGIRPPSFDILKSWTKSFSVGSKPGVFSHIVEYDRVHTPLSMFPRYMRIKNSIITLFKYHVEHLEFKIRQDEIVPLIRDLIGPYGSFREKKTLWDIIRPKRSVQSDGYPEVYNRMKEKLNPVTRNGKPFKLTLSSKLFGREIIYLLLNDSNSVIKSLIDEGTIKIDKDWWSNKLSAGMDFNISARDVLFDVTKKIPTAAGIPLKIKISKTGIFEFNAYGKLEMTPMLKNLPWGNKADEVAAKYRECYSISESLDLIMKVYYRGNKMGYKMQHSESGRCPFPIDEITFNSMNKMRKWKVGLVMNKNNISIVNTSFVIRTFVHEKEGQNHVDQVLHSSNMVGPKLGMGPHAGGGPVPGMKPQSGQAQNPNMGNPGAGPNSVLRKLQEMTKRFGMGQLSGDKQQPGMGQFPVGGGGPPPGSGPLPKQGPHEEKAISGGRPSGMPTCQSAWDNSLSVCKKSSAAGVHIWYFPGKRPVEKIELGFENETQEGDKQFRYLFGLDVKGENEIMIDQYHLELNIRKPPTGPPPPGSAPPPAFLELASSRFSHGSDKKNPSWAGCIKHGINMREKSWKVDVGWGKTCSQYNVTMKVAYTKLNGAPSLNISLALNRLPENMEKLTCPAKHLMKLMENIPQGSVPPGGSPQGGVPPGGLPQGGVLPSGLPQGGVPPGALPQGGVPPGFPGALPCITKLNILLTVKNDNVLEAYGIPTPNSQIFSQKLPFNATEVCEKTKEILKYGITETCVAHQNNDVISTFDKKSYTYQPATGCPHVLARDCSKKDLFTIFLHRTADNKKVVTVVVKDRANRGHVFVIRPDMTVEHDGNVLQLQPSRMSPNKKKAVIPRLCKVTKKPEKLYLTCEAGFTVILDTETIAVKVSHWHFHYMCGLCGDFDWTQKVDFVNPEYEDETSENAFGSSWLVPGKSCNSACKLVHRPIQKNDPKKRPGRICISTVPVLRCAPGCQVTKQTTSKRYYHCMDRTDIQYSKTEKDIQLQMFDRIIKTFKGKDLDFTADTDVHVDCQCNNCLS